LLEKEWRELIASRAWWIFLLLMGPLVGVSFIDAVQTYAEASGLHGTAVGVGEAFSPLIGIWAPTFSACELAAAFLLPFVAIALVSGDRRSGALKLELQHPMPAATRICAKTLVLLIGWAIATIAPLAGVGLWISYGGSVYFPELASVVLGHVLNAGLTVGLAAAAASLTEHPSTAAIVTLGVTVGTWILNFVAAVHGGIWEQAAGYTPTAMVAEFQHGLVRLDVLLIVLVFIGALLALASVWIRLGVSARRRVQESLVVMGATAVLALACTRATPSWDLSESRRNSFAAADEEALKEIRTPLRVEAHLAPQDPRRSDLEQHALSKLRRVMPDVRVQYISATSIGLFEQTAPQYGEIWYELGDRRTMSRATTTEGMLEAIYEISGVTPRAVGDDEIFRGHPLAVPPRGAAVVFYGAWPALVTAAYLVSRRLS
jgi:ABC-type transport system involved in multi-copper enzyme maturation permease subunit